jgi:hypothetical protein
MRVLKLKTENDKNMKKPLKNQDRSGIGDTFLWGPGWINTDPQVVKYLNTSLLYTAYIRIIETKKRRQSLLSSEKRFRPKVVLTFHCKNKSVAEETITAMCFIMIYDV